GLDVFFRNILLTFRFLRTSPGFATTAVLTVALGIGANTAVFSVVDAVLLKPLPYPHPDRLVSVREQHQSGVIGDVMTGNVSDYRKAQSLLGLATYNRTSFALSGSGTPEQLRAEAVSWNLFDVVGVQPAIGRAFRFDDDRPGAERVVILTYAYWRS